MIIKRIIVLANSTKHHPQSCIAGRELLDEIGDVKKWGSWIRPVSTHDEGALSLTERRLTNAEDPKPLDLIRVPLLQAVNNPLQPENWLIQPGQVWSKDSTLAAGELLRLLEQPDDLWLDPSQQNDRASGLYLQRLPKVQSLYLIRPQAFHFHIRSRVWEGYAKKQQRGLFTYRGRHYDLALTDPRICQKYFPDYPQTPEAYIQPADPERILLCVSLTPPFHELHYKVIATVFELPA
jgi:hypothetical protein